MKITPVILSGGSGTRLWPLSRQQHPKQYLPLVGENTMLQETILRLNGLDSLTDPIIICNENHRFLVAEQCHKIGITATISLEPIARNTAPAIAATALQSIKNTDDALLLVLSADHVISDISAFHQSIKIAAKQAINNKLVTFGVVPTNANTGYGYIKPMSLSNDGSYQIETFVEKPNQQSAQMYLKHGYLWNSGMFMFQATTLISELSIHAMDMMQSVEKSVDNARDEFNFIRLEQQSFVACESNSIDYVLMEKSNNVVVVPLDAGWSDIGSWDSLHNITDKDANNNVIIGDVITKDTNNTYIYTDDHLVATIGVDNLIIVNTPDATFIAT